MSSLTQSTDWRKSAESLQKEMEDWDGFPEAFRFRPGDTLTDLLNDFVMANGLADHDPPHAMQLRSMLRAEEIKGNQNHPLSWLELGGMGWSGFGAVTVLL